MSESGPQRGFLEMIDAMKADIERLKRQIEARNIVTDATITKLQQSLQRSEEKQKTATEQIATCMTENGALKAEMVRMVSLELVKQAVMCKICFEVMVDAVLVEGCGHSFCASCIDSWADNSIREDCPVCREEIDRLPIPNYAVRDVAELVVRLEGLSV
ncbi:hypothetical protein VNI00_018747 [Paramarasmius palmivorus]|uniref:RING-type domain-containing protein n=1 Tax=Paramarasmius palmivorus TaxID=297713 RepID=A0AAW0AVJ6_9AGAR